MKKIFKNWWLAVFLGALIFVAGLGIRLYRLTLIPVFDDEAIYIRWAQVMKAEPTLRFVPLSDGKQPLFMWTMMPVFKLFRDPLFVGRFVSVSTGAITLIGVMALTYLLFKSKRAALISGLIYAVSPFTFFFDRMALVDSMLSMFGVWFFIFTYMTSKTRRLDFAMISGFLLGGALLTKSPALFFALLIPSTYIFSNWPKGIRKVTVHLFKLLLLSSVTLAIGYVMYNILRLGPNFNMIAIRNKDYIYPLSHLWTSFKDPLLPFSHAALQWIWAMGPWLMIFLGLFGFVLNLRKYWKEVGILLAWFAIPILVQSEFAKVFTARYILFSIPFLVVLASSFTLAKGKYLEFLFVLFFLGFIFQSAKFDYDLVTNPDNANLPRSERSGYLEDWTAGTGIKEVADLLKEQAAKKPDQRIVVGTEGFFGTLPDGLEIYVNDNPNITVIGVGILIDSVHQSLIDSKKSGNPTYLVVNNTRFSADANKVGLKLLAAYPKAVQPNGSREALLFFEVTPNAIDYKAPASKL